MNELHDFNDLLAYNGIMRSTVNSTLSRQNQKLYEKDFVLKKRKKKSLFIWPVEIIEKQQEHLNFRIPLFVKFAKQHPLRKVKVTKVLKEEKHRNEILKVQDVHYHSQLPEMKNY